MSRLHLSIPAFVMLLAAGEASAGGSFCTPEGAEAVEVTAVDTRLELTLADGRRILVAGVEPPPITDAARTALTDWLIGRAVIIRPLTAQPDRWGRTPALVFAPVEAELAAPLADALLKSGLARLRLTPPVPCLAEWRAAEALARDNGLGVWAQDSTAVLDAGDRAGFQGHDGGNVVVEGKVFAVNASGYRTYINFGPRRYRDFSVTILKPNLKIFDKASLSLQSLTGRRLRVRGMLDMRFGPQIEIASPDAIEIID